MLATDGRRIGATTDPLWQRPSESTNVHNRERTKGFADAYGDRPLRSINATVVAEWLKGGRNRGTVDALRAMFNDACRPQAGMLIDNNPFAALGLERPKGRKNVQPPGQAIVARMIALADDLTPPSFAGSLLTASWPARTTVQAPLAEPEMLVEIEAIAWIGQ